MSDQSSAPLPRMMAACGGSLLTSVLVNPLDVVRVRMQQDSALSHSHPTRPTSVKPHRVSSLAKSTPVFGTAICCKTASWYPSTIDYCLAGEQFSPCLLRGAPRGTFNTLFSIAEREGASVLWRGLSLQLVQSLPSNVVYFMTYEALRDSSPIAHCTLLNPLLCGGFARAVSATAVSPIELFKTRLQSVQGANAFSAVTSSVKDMIRDGGWRSLWSGLGLTLWRDVPFSAIYWCVVEYVRTYFPESGTRSHKTAFIESVVAGSVGGVIAATLTTPFDVGKTRRQLVHHSSPSAHSRMIPCMADILRQEGWQALFVGLLPRVLKVAPACAIMITCYELGKLTFSEFNVAD